MPCCRLVPSRKKILFVTASLQQGLLLAPLQVTPLLPAVNLTVMGVQYALFSQMHHGLGLNDAFDRSVGILQRRQQPTANASDTMLDHQDITPPHSTVSTSLETLPRNQADQHEQLSLTNTPTDFHAGLVPGPALSNSTVGGAVPTRSGRSTVLLGRHGERRPNRRLAEATAAALEHPCLNVGYVRTYTRAGQAPPRNVTLTGRQGCCRGLHLTSLHGCLSGHAACLLLCSRSPGCPSCFCFPPYPRLSTLELGRSLQPAQHQDLPDNF